MLDDREMQRRAAARDAALAAWQARLREFDRLDPPLPVRWSNYREARARGRRKATFLAQAKAALDAARAHYRDGLCARPDAGADPPPAPASGVRGGGAGGP